MKTDIEIAQEAKMKPITQIAAQLGLEEESVIPYGRYKAKIDHRLIHNAHALPARAQPWPRVRRKGRRCRRRLCTGGAHGGYQPALYR